MPMMPLSQLQDWQLDDANKDIRGWPVKDASGQEIGRIKELMVNTDNQTVWSAMLDNGREIPLRELDQRTGFVQLHTPASAAADNVAGAARQAFYGDNAAERDLSQTSSQFTKEAAMVQDTPRQGMSGVTGTESMGQGATQPGAGQDTGGMGQQGTGMASGRAGQATTGLGQGRQEMGQAATGMAGQEDVPEMVTIEEEIIVIAPFEDLEPRFREHHQNRYAGKGPYENYQAAYQHGHALSSSPEHRGKTWEEVRPHAKSTWEAQNPGMPYEDYEEAIGEGYAMVGGL